MYLHAKLLLLAALFAVGWATDSRADKKTVCTITVNSSDEKEVFRQRLPADQYEFVELVERGRPDWLASACRQGIRCDLLVISGHFDGSTAFYSDQVAASEFLPVAELERASCSNSCPALFSQLKEVYLFGCNTLNADAIKSASSEAGRSLIRAGYSPVDARRIVHALDQLHGESSRDRMRRIFTNVPVIYGFSSVAPLGTQRGGPARPLPRSVLDCRCRQRSCESQASRPLCHRVHDRRQRLERVGVTRGLSARILSIRRRPTDASSQTRIYPRPPAPRYGGSPHVPRSHRRPVCIVERNRAARPAFHQNARRDRAR